MLTAFSSIDHEWLGTFGALLKGRHVDGHAEAGLTPKDIYGGPQGAIAQLAGLTAWFAQQTEFCFYSSSVLIIYEGAATRTEDAHVSIRLVRSPSPSPVGLETYTFCCVKVALIQLHPTSPTSVKKNPRCRMNCVRIRC